MSARGVCSQIVYTVFAIFAAEPGTLLTNEPARRRRILLRTSLAAFDLGLHDFPARRPCTPACHTRRESGAAPGISVGSGLLRGVGEGGPRAALFRLYDNGV